MLSPAHRAVDPYIPLIKPDADLKPVPEAPMALLASSPIDRLAAQQSVFTLHGSLQIGLDEFEDCDQFLRKAVVPGDHVLDLATELQVVGMNETSVFPDLDGLGREMNMLTML